MNKENFFSELKSLLSSMDKAEYDKFIRYYEEIFEDYREDGLTDEEIINKIGSPKSIAKNILGNQDTVHTKSSTNKILTTVLLILGFPLWGSLLLAFLSIVFSFFIVILCAPFTTGVLSFSFFAASVMSIVGFPFMVSEILPVGIVQLGFGISSLGIAILSGIITIYLSKTIIMATKKVASKILNMFNTGVVRLWY